MIKIETDTGWWLIRHQDHAQLAGKFARHWRNDHFAPPEPFEAVLQAICHHDDAWAERDASPKLTAAGQPSAFSKELVGTYDAFEEVDLFSDLKARAMATDTIAEKSPYAAMIVSMHSVNLLTEQSNLQRLDDEAREFHSTFIQDQMDRQEELGRMAARNPRLAPYCEHFHRQRAFEFFQCCDSLSLAVCVRYASEIRLRHPQPMKDGSRTDIFCAPLGDNTYQLSPNPMDQNSLAFSIPAKFVSGKQFASIEEFRSTYEQAESAELEIHIVS